MPFYIRKSISAGPFRFNLSKSGVGMSVGVKGLRIGTGPRGHYIHAGRGGLYYRASLGRAGERHAPSPVVPQSPVPKSIDRVPGVEMVEVESADVMVMRDGKFSELLDELNAIQATTPLAAALPGIFIILAGISLFFAKAAVITFLVCAGIGLVVGLWFDAYQRRSVLFYDLDAAASAAYERLTAAFDQMKACKGTWHIAAGGIVSDLTTWKRNAGATRIVEKKATTFGYGRPGIVAANIDPPMVAVGKQTIYFFPDVVLVFDGRKFGAVEYCNLSLRWEPSRFIEEGRVPSDATIVGHTWAHPNKDGSPDRRFSRNWQIPICLYEVLHLTSANGLNELVEFSRTGVSAPFAQAVDGLLRAISSKGASSVPQLR